MADTHSFKSDGRTYFWQGTYGAVIKSFERGVRVGDVRIIEGELFYARFIYPHGLRAPEVCWIVQRVSDKEIAALHARFFGGRG